VVITNAVDAQLVEAQELEKYNHKILLLGAGESGKSTVVKQIKLIWKVGGGPSDKEKQEYILAIRRNCIEAIQTLLEASKNLDVPLKNKDLQPVFDKMLAYDTNNPVTTEIGNDINALWRDEGIQVVYSRRDEFWNMDATAYYLNEVLRLAEEDYRYHFSLSPPPSLPLSPSADHRSTKRPSFYALVVHRVVWCGVVQPERGRHDHDAGADHGHRHHRGQGAALHLPGTAPFPPPLARAFHRHATPYLTCRCGVAVVLTGGGRRGAAE
jgi:hypothetical protein